MPFKRPPSKAELRQQLDREISQYLDHGGKVDKVPAGQSGRDDRIPMRTVLFDGPKAPRTYVNDLVATIDERKKPRKPLPVKKRNRQGGRYKTLYDDFGEPIRRVWVDE